MKSIVAAIVITCFAQAAGAKERSASETLLWHMPCGAWIIMHENDWSGGKRDQIEVETWTLRFLRGYAKDAVVRFKENEPQKPEAHWTNADGADVDDRRVLDWFKAWCLKNPREPLMKGAYMLTAFFW